MKICFTLYIIEKMQAKTTQCSITTHRLEELNPEQWQRQLLVETWSNRSSDSLLVETQSSTITLENSLTVSYKAKYILTNQAVTLLGIYSNELKNDVHIKTYKQMFTAALFIIAKHEATKTVFSRWMDK